MPEWAAYVVSLFSLVTLIASNWDKAIRLMTRQLKKLSGHIVELLQVWTDFRYDLRNARIPSTFKQKKGDASRGKAGADPGTVTFHATIQSISARNDASVCPATPKQDESLSVDDVTALTLVAPAAA